MNDSKKHIVIGTAGHIDHGKSALIKALTGIDPDRLKEEKERGMTTDLGFVFYGDDVTIIDVPGHEKFVRHMVAGASTLDFVIFVIAADDGVMPQTVEHLEILKLLDIKKGFVAVTKKDLVDDELLQIALADIKDLVKGTFLEGTPVIPVSNTTKEGIEELKNVLDRLIAETKAKQDKGIFRLPIDRCFVMKGFGTVVAGTVLSGTVKVGDTIELLPQKQRVKIRGIQVHNHTVSEVTTGFRAAINIVGAEKSEIKRGDILGQEGFFEPSDYLNVSIYLLKSAEKPLKNFTRVRIHLGTKEVLGRVVFLDKKELTPGQKAMAQFRLEIPAVCDVGDRYVIRTYSPQTTIGGGVIIEPKAQKAKGFDEKLIEHLHKIETGDPLSLVEENLNSNYELPRKIEEIAHEINLPIKDVERIVQNFLENNTVLCIDSKRGLYYTHGNLLRLKKQIKEILQAYHKQYPTSVGMTKLELIKEISTGLDKSLLQYVLTRMTGDNDIHIEPDGKIRSSGFKAALNKELDQVAKKIEKIYTDAGFKPPMYKTLLTEQLGPEKVVQKAYKYMLDTGTLVNVGENVVFHSRYIKDAKHKLVDFLKKKNEIRISEFRDLIGASRKYALPLLVYFDTRNVTIKRGEVRVLGQKYR
jgi:selenocysteine-specific elongation factor